MRKLSLTRLILAVTGLWGILTGCDNDTDPAVLQLVTSSNYVAGNRALVGGKSILTAIYAQAPAADAPLTKFQVSFKYDSVNVSTSEIIFLDSTLAANTTTFAMVVNYTPRNLTGKEHWNFSVTDSKGKVYSQQLRFKTSSLNKETSDFYTYTNVLLSRLKNKNGTQDSTGLGLIGFSSADGTGYPYYVVKQPTITSRVDLMFNKHLTAKPSLSINSASAPSLLLTGVTSAEFDAVKTADKLKTSYPATGTGQATLANLQTGQVIAYKTVASKVGLLRVSKVYKTLDSLQFDVKAEK